MVSKRQGRGKQSLPAESGIQWDQSLLRHERYHDGTLSWRWMDTSHEDKRKKGEI